MANSAKESSPSLMRLALAWLLLMGSGCGLATGAKPYVAPGLDRLDASGPRLLAAAYHTVRDLGWNVVRLDKGSGELEAVTPESSLAEVTTRERWMVRVSDREVSAAMRLEARWIDDSGGWQSSDEVCAGYEYQRERAFLASVVARVRVILPESSAASAARRPRRQKRQLPASRAAWGVLWR